MQELPKALAGALSHLDASGLDYLNERLADRAAKLSGKGTKAREQLLDAFAQAFDRDPIGTVQMMARFCLESVARKRGDIGAETAALLAMVNDASNFAYAMDYPEWDSL